MGGPAGPLHGRLDRGQREQRRLHERDKIGHLHHDLLGMVGQARPARHARTIYKAFRTGFHARGRARGRNRNHPSQLAETSAMPTRYWIILALSLLAGIAVLFSRPTGRKPRSSVPWRGQVKPPPPPP